MTNLKDDLTNYLSKKETSKSSLSGSLTSLLSKDSFSFQKSNNEIDNSETWFESTQKDCCPNLTQFQRISGFIICNLLGMFFFTVSFFYIPLLLLKARKFALLYSLGSLCFLFSFSFLWGPLNHLKHLFNKERLLFSTTYIGNIFLTIYSALIIQNTAVTILCAVLQFISLLWFLLHHIPGGKSGMKFFSKLFTMAFSKKINKSLPI